MRSIRNQTAVMLLCLFSLFYIPADGTFVLAFLLGATVCCADTFFTEDRFYGAACLLLFAAGIFLLPSALFFPAAGYGLFRRKLYGISALGLLCLTVVLYHRVPPVLFCLELFAFLVSFLLATGSEEQERLEQALRTAQDDSTERDLLLTEKARILQERQDTEIYTATLRERNRIAREIHDNVGHLLSRSILLVGAARTVNREAALSPALDHLDQTLNQAMDSIRSSVHDLRDESVNLEEVLGGLTGEFTFCPVSYIYDGGNQIPKEVKYCFISIVKEALSNIMRHSSATRASVTLREHPALYQLCIEDNGSPPPSLEEGMGLTNMRDRVSQLGGHIFFYTDHGFRILISIPRNTRIKYNDEESQ